MRKLRMKQFIRYTMLALSSAIWMFTNAPVFAQSQPGGFVRVNKSVDNPSPNSPLQTIEFTIEAVGIGDTTASNVILQEILPTGLEVPDGMAAFTSAGDYDPDTGQWTVADMEPDQKEVMTLPAIVVADPQPACIVNSVSASANDSRFIDNRASVSVRRPGIERCADLTARASPSSSVPRAFGRGGAEARRGGAPGSRSAYFRADVSVLVGLPSCCHFWPGRYPPQSIPRPLPDRNWRRAIGESGLVVS